MIIVETENSIYSVEVENGLFKITKTGELNPRSQYNAVGRPRYASGISLTLGSKAYITGHLSESWSTSVVKRIS